MAWTEAAKESCRDAGGVQFTEAAKGSCRDADHGAGTFEDLTMDALSDTGITGTAAGWTVSRTEGCRN